MNTMDFGRRRTGEGHLRVREVDRGLFALLHRVPAGGSTLHFPRFVETRSLQECVGKRAAGRRDRVRAGRRRDRR